MEWLEKLATASIIAVTAIIVYAIVKNVIARLVETRIRNREAAEPRIDTLKTLLSSLTGYVIFFIAFVAILREFDVDTTGILASAGILGLAIGFGAQGLVSDIVTGFFVLLENQVNVGEYVTINGYSGIVEETGLRCIKVRGMNGDLHYIPNREIGALTNHSRGNMQALVDIGIAYESNVDEAIQVMQKACDRLAQDMPQIVEGPNVLGVQSLENSDMVIRILAKTENGEQWAVERALRKELKKALDEAGIEIPYPHRTIVQK
ncbi:mechanosensitive ion channel family protein [Desmospora profundinema]|uniref:Small conductance mechanosensitive channel n=1 Tax=Desmospora profundinema TaxID=1571184 RepID=A0ABU1IPJ5_9BACL|nr:mechanosensitive ion channel family protein [Desmospora profundinema]MDR6226695.1 small conductance mechanosensitive channel [Desmospora profundinema]